MGRSFGDPGREGNDPSPHRRPLPLRRAFQRFVVLMIGIFIGVLLLAAPSRAADAPRRVVSAAPNLTEILYDLGLADRIAAVTDHCDHPLEVKTKPRIGGFTNPSLEAIVARQPDLVVLTRDGNPPILAARLSRLGISTYLFRATRIEELPGEIRSLGADLGVRSLADRKAAELEARFRDLASRAGPLGKGRRALFVIQAEPLIAAGRGTVLDSVMTLLGLENLGRVGEIRYPPFSLEEMIRLQPDWLFFGKGHPAAAAQAQALIRRLPSLSAVRMGRVCFVSETVYRLGPRLTAGIAEMADCLADRP